MNTIAGALSLACLKRSRTRDAPTPTIASTNSDAAIEKNGTSASPATARASSVLPVPGGPRGARRAGSGRPASGTAPAGAGSPRPRSAPPSPRRSRPRPRTSRGRPTARTASRSSARTRRARLARPLPAASARTAGTRTGASGRTRAAGSPTRARPCRAAWHSPSRLCSCRRLESAIRVRERRDLGGEPERRLRAAVALRLREGALHRRAFRCDRRDMAGLAPGSGRTALYGTRTAGSRLHGARAQEDVQCEDDEEEDEPARAGPERPALRGRRRRAGWRRRPGRRALTLLTKRRRHCPPVTPDSRTGPTPRLLRPPRPRGDAHRRP